MLLPPGLDQITRTQASFDFELERRVLSESAAGQGTAAAHAPLQVVDDPFQLVLERYMQMGYEVGAVCCLRKSASRRSATMLGAPQL